MTSPRRLLLICALGLVGADAAFLAWRWRQDSAPNASLISVGLDSMSLSRDGDKPALTLEAGQWRLGGRAPDWDVYRVTATSGTIPIVAVQNYGQWLEAVRDLKRRRICNVAMRDGAAELPMIVLCGRSLGDVGFSGTLPPDKPVRVARDWPGRH